MAETVWVDRCSCGHAKDDHKLVVGQGRIAVGSCGRCSCLVFKLRPSAPEPKTFIEEESGPVEPKVWPEEAAYWTDDADGDPIIPTAMSEIGENLQSEGRSLQVTDLTEPMDLTPAERDAFIAAAEALDDRPLASWDSWWCETCGARRFKAGSCHGVMRPVRVELHAREP